MCGKLELNFDQFKCILPFVQLQEECNYRGLLLTGQIMKCSFSCLRKVACICCYLRGVSSKAGKSFKIGAAILPPPLTKMKLKAAMWASGCLTFLLIYCLSALIGRHQQLRTQMQTERTVFAPLSFSKTVDLVRHKIRKCLTSTNDKDSSLRIPSSRPHI